MLRSKKHTDNTCGRRLNIISYFFFIFCFIFIFKLFLIQVQGHEKYRAMANDQYWNLQEIPSRRGDILTSDGHLIATTRGKFLMFGEPHLVENPQQTAKQIYDALKEVDVREEDISLEKLTEVLSKELRWVVLQRDLNVIQKDKISSMGIKGIGFDEEPVRYYPENTLASHILGFVASDENGDRIGYFGIEGMFNEDLKGRPGRIVQETDALGEPILVGSYKRIDPSNGRDIVLTINRSVQYILEKRLKEGVEKYGATSGTAIVMDPATGEVIAMANFPTYNPSIILDETAESTSSTMSVDRKSFEKRNLAVAQTYEPGSVLKALTVATAVDLGKVTQGSTFIDNGPVEYSGYFIDNWDKKHHGQQTVVELLQKSNNIGAAWVGHLTGAKDLSTYFKNFGLGSKTQIELEGEDTGIIRDYNEWTDIDLATVSFGQGISATPLQVLNSFNVLANGGNLMQPKIISEIRDGDKIIEIPSRKIRSVIKKDTAEKMSDMLIKSVDGGESKYFNIKNYKIAGKTGTAQIPLNGKYDPTKTNATFVGYLATSRKFSMLVKVEKPTSSFYAAETAVPLWMTIAEDLVKYYGIPTDL